MTPPLLRYPRWRLSYYTTPAHLPQMEITLLHHPANLPQMEISLLHHPSSFTLDGDYPTTPPPAHVPQMG